MVEQKQTVKVEKPKFEHVLDLWSKEMKPIPIKQYVEEAGDTEKMLVFSESGGGKTHFYLGILDYLKSLGYTKEQLLMNVITPDRPKGLAALYGLIPKEFRDDVVNVFPVSDYEETIMSTATSVRLLTDFYKKTRVAGYSVFELTETYWAFSQDSYCKLAYGKSMAEYFAQMQNVLSSGKATQEAAYQAFAGPFGGPWPIIKMMHNMNWIDKLKRLPFHMIFTSELKEEENKDSIFASLGFRPAGEKHLQHKFDTILYLSHKGNDFYMKPYKLTGYTKLYGEIKITDKNGYEEHKKACKRLEELGYKVTKVDDMAQQAGIVPPIPKKEPVKEEKQIAPSSTEPKKDESWTI